MDRMPNVAFIKPTPYQICMDIWKRYNALKDIPSDRMGGFDNLQDIKDFMRQGEAIEAMVNDLPMHMRWAVWKSRGVCTCWNFPTVNFAEAVSRAEEILTPKLQQHVALSKYFR